jgi:hypothetical protein
MFVCMCARKYVEGGVDMWGRARGYGGRGGRGEGGRGGEGGWEGTNSNLKVLSATARIRACP